MTRKSYSRFATCLPLLCLLVLALVATASAEWKEKVLYSFQGGTDGSAPAGGVVFDKSGNLYGANSWGGSGGCPSPGCGTVFELSPPGQKGGAWTETSIYAFRGVNGATDGFTPAGGLIVDAKGSLYGTTAYGGNGPCVLLGTKAGCGIVYELSPPARKGGQWTYQSLYNFQGGNDGYVPSGNLVFDNQGNIYGATQFGGGKGTACNIIYGGQCGTVFKLSPPKQKGGKWTEKILHSFAGGTDGASPNGGLIFDKQGAVYGTTYFGGYEGKFCNGGVGGTGCGSIYALRPTVEGTWAEKVLHRFNGLDGANSSASLVFDGDGNLYGATFAGPPNGSGLIFELAKPSGRASSWTEAILCLFNDESKGGSPISGLVFDASGSLFGTASADEDFRGGDIFQLKPDSKGGGWTFDLLHGFTGSPDAATPAASLIADKSGNLYGTTKSGGTGQCQGGCGTVFEVSP